VRFYRSKYRLQECKNSKKFKKKVDRTYTGISKSVALERISKLNNLKIFIFDNKEGENETD